MVLIGINDCSHLQDSVELNTSQINEKPVNMMGAEDSTLHARFGNVTFEPAAQTNWHLHPGGQELFITEGEGYYEAKGQPAQLLRKGDVVEIPPYVVHWHGAGPDSEFAHIAISLNRYEGGAVWSGPVTDEEYAGVHR
jgi:quercetin dioxygenase-like cupin family protein